MFAPCSQSTYFCLRKYGAATGQPDNIMWTCFYADPASGTQLGFEVKYHRFPMLHPVDLFICDGIHGVEFKGVDGACDHTIITAGTTIHVNVHCKCHAFFTHQL